MVVIARCGQKERSLVPGSHVFYTEEVVMRYGNRSSLQSTVRAFFPLVVALGLLVGIVGCDGDDDEVRITSTSPLPSGTVRQAYTFTFASENGGQFWALQEGQLPPGMGLLPSGVLRGTPTTAGTFTFTVTVFQEVIEEFVDPGDVWFDPVFGFIFPVDPVVYDEFAVDIENDSAQFSLTIN
jgi:hypothetical protein